MDSIRVAIVEDEFIIGQDISANLENQGYQVTGIYESGTEAIVGIKRDPPDILLMDINIKGELDGIETVEIIRNSWDIPFIYVTAYSDTLTLDRAKKTLPHAYIIKPFSFKNLNMAIELAVHNYSKGIRVPVSEARQYPEINEQEHISKNTIFIKEKGRFIKVITSEIQYLCANGSYCEISTAKKNFTISYNLQNILGKLNSSLFMRVHRSYAVNINEICSINEDELQIGEMKIPISKASRNELLDRVKYI